MKILANDGMSQSGIDALEEKGFEVITTKIAQEQLENYINENNINQCANLGIVSGAALTILPFTATFLIASSKIILVNVIFLLEQAICFHGRSNFVCV